MFGHQDDQPAQQDSGIVTEEPMHEPPGGAGGQPDDSVQADSADNQDAGQTGDDPETLIIKPSADEQAPADQAANLQQSDQTADLPQDQTDNSGADVPTDNTWQEPGASPDSPPNVGNDVISPAGGFPKRPTFQYPAASDNSDTADSIAGGQPSDAQDNSQDVDELINVKKLALEELIPLIDKLELPPEEKFRTLMMMIQASDDERLVKAAYEAAHSIEDEKARAQALLDVVNEVNYFTQQPAVGQQPDDQIS